MAALSPATVSLMQERVSWLDAEIDATLSSFSADLDLYRWCRYHLGWLDQRLEPLSDPERKRHGGKRLRGVLTILASEAVGGPGKEAAAAGAAIELIHNFSLVHDDVEDNDAERRHRPTVWKLWGIPHAINVGSNMQAMVDAAVLRLAAHFPAATVVEAFQVITRSIVLMTEGQYLDMAAQDADTMSLESYFRMTGGKTAALVSGAMQAGALLGSPRDPGRVERLGAFGWSFGLAFQCRDDYLGVWGEPTLTGKPVGSDILQGKRSLPVVHALASAPAGTPEGARLRQALQRRDVPAVLELFEALGTVGFVRERVEEHTRSALSALDSAGIDNPSGAAIRDIARYALGRES